MGRHGSSDPAPTVHGSADQAWWPALAAAAGTISYELFCALAPRVPVVVRGRAA